jgi:hypothetical protein
VDRSAQYHSLFSRLSHPLTSSSAMTNDQYGEYEELEILTPVPFHLAPPIQDLCANCAGSSMRSRRGID